MDKIKKANGSREEINEFWGLGHLTIFFILFTSITKRRSKPVWTNSLSLYYFGLPDMYQVWSYYASQFAGNILPAG